MEGVRQEIARAIDWLKQDVEERHYQATMLIRIAVADHARKKVAQELDAVLAVVPMLNYGAKHPTTIVAVEALAFLLTQDPKGREQLRSTDAHAQLVDMLRQMPYSNLAHRILLVLQTIADKEADRKLLVSCDCATALKPFLVSNFSAEVVEHALSVVCNIAAGSHMAKGHIRDAGLIEPLLAFLAPQRDPHLAQLAALALRNLSRHNASKVEIMKHNGVHLLLSFLSEGLETLQYPLHCDIMYQKSSPAVSAITHQGLMAIDIGRGQLILSPEKGSSGICSCLTGSTISQPCNLHIDATAERYPLMMKALRFTTPHESQLELQFDVDGRGVERLTDKPKVTRGLQLMRVVIDECDALELSELITKLLNKLYTQQDFKEALVSPQSSIARMSLAAAQPSVLPV